MVLLDPVTASVPPPEATKPRPVGRGNVQAVEGDVPVLLVRLTASDLPLLMLMLVKVKMPELFPISTPLPALPLKV